MTEAYEGRHPGTRHIMQYFTYGHLAKSEMQAVSAACGQLAEQMVATLPDSPELTEGLRKLLEAKDCLVRAMVTAIKTEQPLPKNTWDGNDG